MKTSTIITFSILTMIVFSPIQANPRFNTFLKAIIAGNTSEVAKMIRSGYNVNEADETGFTPVMAASRLCHTDILKNLVSNRANVNAANVRGETALHFAVNDGKLDCVKILIESGASVDAADHEYGATPLIYAAIFQHKEIVAFLLEAGASTMHKAKNGMTPFDFASSKKNLPIMKLIDSELSEAYEIPDDRALLLGEFYDSDGVREPGIICTLKGTNGAAFTETTDSRGRFKMQIPKNTVYSIECDKFGNPINFDDKLTIPEQKGPYLQRLNLIVTYIMDYKKVIKLENIYFDTGKYDLTKTSAASLKPLLDAMKENKKMVVEIAGHTDNAGSKESNMELSRRRAESVRSYLIKNGIEKERLLAKGYGPVKPVADNNTESGKRKNRRTEARVIQE